jgi:hypothetical protein
VPLRPAQLGYWALSAPLHLTSRPAIASDVVSVRRGLLTSGAAPAASEVSRLIDEARDLNLPVEPGVREGRDALVRWSVLLEELLS